MRLFFFCACPDGCTQCVHHRHHPHQLRLCPRQFSQYVLSLSPLEAIWNKFLRRRTVNHAGRVVWSNIHLGTAIICACLPTYRPLLIMGGACWSLIRQRYFPKGPSRKWFKQSASTDSPFTSHGINRSARDRGDAIGAIDEPVPRGNVITQEEERIRDLLKRNEESHRRCFPSPRATSTV